MPASAHDAAVRQQIYLEGVKNYQADSIDDTNTALLLLLIALVASYGYDSLASMPKKVLRSFTADFNAKANDLVAKFSDSFFADLKGLVGVDAKLSSSVFSSLTGNRADLGGTKLIWSGITNDFIPGTGHLPYNLVADFFRSTVNQFGLLFRRAYSEGWTTQQLITEVQGTRALKYKNGLLRRVKNQFNTVQQTLTQHAHGFITFNIGRLFYDFYQWISVLDGQTTDICRGRANHVFEYANGPRPPAHYNCRSTIMALASEVAQPSPNNFYKWLVAQPLEFQNDFMGVARAQALRAGRLSASDIPKFDGTRKITPEEFGKKQPLILA